MKLQNTLKILIIFVFGFVVGYLYGIKHESNIQLKLNKIIYLHNLYLKEYLSDNIPSGEQIYNITFEMAKIQIQKEN